MTHQHTLTALKQRREKVAAHLAQLDQHIATMTDAENVGLKLLGTAAQPVAAGAAEPVAAPKRGGRKAGVKKGGRAKKAVAATPARAPKPVSGGRRKVAANTAAAPTSAPVMNNSGVGGVDEDFDALA